MSIILVKKFETNTYSRGKDTLATLKPALNTGKRC